MLTTRTGNHYPGKAWGTQRNAWAQEVWVQAILQVQRLKSDGWDLKALPLRCPVKLSGVIRYPDTRTADLDGVIGSLGHVLERAGVIANDKLIVAVAFENGMPVPKGCVTMTLETEWMKTV